MMMAMMMMERSGRLSWRDLWEGNGGGVLKGGDRDRNLRLTLSQKHSEDLGRPCVMKLGKP
jgi:hypothetical protein